MKLLLTSAVVVVGLSTMGCATVLHGTSQRVEVISEPPGAEVFLDDELVGTTPTEVVLSRRATPRLRIVDQSTGNAHSTRVGHSLRKLELVPNLAAGAFFGYGFYGRSAEDRLEGNLAVGIFAFLAPMIVDFVLGGPWEYQSSLDFKLQEPVELSDTLPPVVRSIKLGKPTQ